MLVTQPVVDIEVATGNFPANFFRQKPETVKAPEIYLFSVLPGYRFLCIVPMCGRMKRA
jgi:hypothetical protein